MYITFFLPVLVRLEHHGSKDHTATIMDMTTSETLELCATSSRDNTVRIWDEENCLVKVTKYNFSDKIFLFFLENSNKIMFLSIKYI